MDVHVLHARVPGHVQQGQRVVDGAMGGLLRQQGEEVQGCPTRLHSLQGVQEHGVVGEGPVLHGVVQPHVILEDHPARAQVDVPGFGVAGLPRRQAHRGAGGFQPGIGIGPKQVVPCRGAGGEDGVVVRGRVQSPTVADEQQHLAGMGKAEQGLPCHLLGLLDAHGGKDRGRHIAEPAALSELLGPLAQGDAGHQIGGVGHVRLALGGVQDLDVAVVRCN